MSILQSQVSEAVQALRAKRVPFAVQAAQQQDGGLLGVVANLIVPVALLGGLLFLLRGGPGGQGGGPFGGGDGPMGMLQSRAKVEVEPETGADAASFDFYAVSTTTAQASPSRMLLVATSRSSNWKKSLNFYAPQTSSRPSGRSAREA